jgi:hypothetical protein
MFEDIAFGISIIANVAIAVSVIIMAWQSSLTKKANKELREQLRAMKDGNKAMMDQYHAMENANIASAYFTILKKLQKDEVRDAREAILDAFKAAKKQSKPIDFSDDQKLIKDAELVASTYDAVGRLLERNFLPYEFVYEGAHDAIVKCWEAIHPLLEQYKKERGDDYWNGFKMLYDKTKPYDDRIKGII